MNTASDKTTILIQAIQVDGRVFIQVGLEPQKVVKLILSFVPHLKLGLFIMVAERIFGK